MDERTRTRSARNDRLTYIGQMMNIKKAAPKWSHLSEQLTRCAVCVNNHKPGHDNRDQAGGQLSCLLGPYCAAIFIRSEREYFFRNSSRTKAHGANLSDSCSSAIFSCSLFVFCDGVLVDSLLVIVCTCKAMRRSSSRHGADSNYSFDSMPRLSNSRRKSLFIHPERLSSPSSFMAMLKRSNKSASRRSCTENLSFLLSLVDIVYLEYNNGLTVTMYTNDTTKAKPAGAMNTNGLLTKPLIEVTIMAIKEHSLLFIHTQTPRKRNNPFHGSVLCTHPGGRFLPDLSRRGYLSTKSSRANFSGGTKRGAGGGIFVLVSSSSSLAQASDCLCRMISSSCVCVSCIGDSVLLVMILPCKAMRRSTSHHGADSDYSDSLALRRWRRLISPRMAVTINCAVLSPVSFTCSIASTTSCGARACNFCDLLLIWSLSISGSLCDYWNPVYTKKTKTKRLKWIPLSDYTGIQLSVYHSMQTRLKRIAVLSQPLTTNDSNSIEVAMRNHITHPQGRDPHNLNKYIWRFIALSTAKPRVIHIVATSEQEARRQSPAGCVMVFTARIRQGV
ncbi:host cell division inhibitor Icd-like protein, partial [Escherichia coli]|nr:host cell division inhibitor Icd-like protein [Escherichia coli]EFL7787655.1 host cell division inhibitor Icd-like protein [Escherichia coli]EHZ0588245.1 host cell division inhibitor Icd-like protein [Escherichia coli]EJB5476485.1 host cell division inhibitor Icd-like protein [Escherichia coli]EKK3304456.1 host cell division inhibitor Icd-like protein [Escherichia coli]